MSVRKGGSDGRHGQKADVESKSENFGHCEIWQVSGQ